MSEKVGIAVIGTGFARKVQIPAFLACENTHIASVASGSLANARAAADECGAAHFTDDWRESVARADVDLICITTPPNLPRDMALFAIEHGKHVICEKPMAMDLADAEEIAAAAKDRPLLALIDHELRFQPGRRIAYQMLRDGAIGKVRHVKCLFQAPNRGDVNIPWNWWSDVNSGGGALGAINSHIIDSIHWFLDTSISNVFCQLQSQVKQRPDGSGGMRGVTSDDQANMLLRLADGELTSDATVLVSVSMTERPKYKNQMEFHGETGAIRVDHRGELFVVKNGEMEWTAIPTDVGTLLPGMPDTGFASAFMFLAPVIVDAIRTGKTMIDQAATFADGVKVQRVLDAARRSHVEGRVIEL